MNKPTPPEVRRWLARECGLFTRYLVGEKPTPAIVQRYQQAVATLDLLPTGRPDRLDRWTAMPGLLAPLDSAAAARKIDLPFRRRLLVLSAILEASIDYTDHFLPRAPGFFELIWLGVRAVWARAVLAPIGFLLLRLAGDR